MMPIINIHPLPSEEKAESFRLSLKDADKFGLYCCHDGTSAMWSVIPKIALQLIFNAETALPVTERPWVGLTDEEIEQMGLSNYIKVVRETEDKLKDKNTNPAVYGTTQVEKPEAINAGIERTSRLRKAMDKEHEYMNYREAFPKREYVMPVDRNEVLEEVAKAVYNFKAFEKDTMDSFAIYIRSMKR